MRNGHLVRGRRLSVRLVLAGGAARRGSTGWRRRGGDGAGGGADHAAAVGAAQSGRGRLLFFGLLTGKLGDAEDELEAAQFDVAAVVEQSGALPARPATADQAGSACLTAARRLRATAAALRLARHHAAREHKHGLRARSAVVFTLLTAACKIRGVFLSYS